MESEQLDFEHVKMRSAQVFILSFSQNFFGMVDKSVGQARTHWVQPIHVS